MVNLIVDLGGDHVVFPIIEPQATVKRKYSLTRDSDVTVKLGDSAYKVNLYVGGTQNNISLYIFSQKIIGSAS